MFIQLTPGTHYGVPLVQATYSVHSVALPNGSDLPSIAVNLRELASLCETFTVLLATFHGTCVAGVE